MPERVASHPYSQRDLRTESLDWRLTEGAVAVQPLLSLEALGAILSSHPGSSVVISDIHGHDQLLRGALQGLGLLASDDRRLCPESQLIALGDIVHASNPGDFDTLELVRAVFDCALVGNHDAANLGGPAFEGFVGNKPEITGGLMRMAREGKLLAAKTVGDIVLTHSGVHDCLFNEELGGDEVADRLNEHWFDFLGNQKKQSKLLFEISAARIPEERRPSDASLGGGVLWGDWTHLVNRHPNEFRQIVGHTIVGRPEQSRDGLVYAIDLAGYRLGIAVITPDGAIHIGSDFLIP